MTDGVAKERRPGGWPDRDLASCPIVHPGENGRHAGSQSLCRPLTALAKCCARFPGNRPQPGWPGRRQHALSLAPAMMGMTSQMPPFLRGLAEGSLMALPVLSPEQRQEALAKAREARAARSALLAGVKAGTLTLAGVLGRDDDLARKTKVNQVIRALPGVGKARAAAIMERAGIPAERRVGGLGARQREQLLAQLAGE